MIITVKNSAPFQILTSAMVIGPSQTGYQLEVAADGRNFSPLFSVGPNVTRQATNLSSGAYYRLNGNVGDVVVNWRTSCVTEGGGGASGTELSPVSEFPAGAEAGTVIAYSGSSSASGVYQYDGNEWTEVGADIDLSAYWTSAETQSALTAVEDHLFDVEEVTASALTELHEGLLEVSANSATKSYVDVEVLSARTDATNALNGFYSSYILPMSGDIQELSAKTATNPNILAAITTDEEYGAISGSVKTGDLIEVWNVDINDDNNPEYGLFVANVYEEEDEGVVRKTITWERRDSPDSVFWSGNDYPWMVDNDVNPIEIGVDTFIISSDMAAEDEAYNGIGFDADGKPVITHIVPQYDDVTGEVTGITREDRDILGELDTLDEVVSAALVDLNEKKVESEDIKHIVKLTWAEYDQLATKDPETFYIIINNNNN